jgi:hypothetical protein
MINSKIAPPLPEEQTRVPVPDWMRKFQQAYSGNVFVGLLSALLAPSKAKAIETDSGRVTYWLLLNLAASLVPFILVGGTLWLVWWYVVIHQQADAVVAVTGVEQLGTPGLAPKAASPA